jgi:UrcA family protein
MIIGVFAAALCATAASAEPVVEVRTSDRAIAVQYADLDLTRTEDARAMVSRLRYAAYVACEDQSVLQRVSTLERSERTCRTTAVEDALVRLDQAQVTASYEALR